MKSELTKNVLGGLLQPCSFDTQTGFFRDGYCHTCMEDIGMHTVCALVTEEFLAFSKQQGNDLSTPRPEWGFPGLKEGDQWCLCALRWAEAREAGVAPAVVLESTHENTLNVVPLAHLKPYAAH
ncbi:hypothetical protein SAMN05660443_0875 [Marinospirillum celere]|uniref:DUF2237 domain-containing protein n=1 Tax=Marinospirillum celere TaxID=1122252 RepID=A0A1I1EV39_9GAMM|nr:DUF2237 domain-containing protein [Marinospirillum celere]SFB90974.1 hypothetical protein SAMN05660443_0875 [Marinospirillum celere]